MRLIYIFCVASQIVLSNVRVDYVEAYYDVMSKNFDLFRPKINKDNSIISAEIYTKSIYKLEGQDDDQIIFFKRDSEYGSKKGYHFIEGETIVGETKRCTTGYVVWAKKNKSDFYSLKKSIDQGYRLCQSRIKGFDQTDQIDKIIPMLNKRGNALVDLTGSKSKKIVYDASYIKSHKVMELNNRDINFMLYSDLDNKIQVKSNHRQYEKGFVIAENNNTITKTESFDVSQRYNTSGNLIDRYKVVFEERDNEYQNRIYFTCDIEQPFIPIYPSKKHERAPQVEPLFNSKGDKIAFLNLIAFL